MKNKENMGISMIAVVITIISMIILIAIAFNVGDKYLNESRNTEQKAIINLVADSIRRREEDISIGIETTYVGYKLVSNWYENGSWFKDLPDEINEGIYFLIDASEGKKLGINGLEKYITNDFMQDSLNGQNEYVKVLIVNYQEDLVYLVKANTQYVTFDD